MHGPTYMANALACAAANASLDLFEREPRLEAGAGDRRADDAGACAVPRHQGRQGCAGEGRDRRRRDGADRRSSNALRARFVEEGVFIRPFGNVIYLTPSFTIGADELSKLTERDRARCPVTALERLRRAVPCRSYSSDFSIFTVTISPTFSGRLLFT